MMPTLTNYLGLWALLGIPLVVVIHFLQQRSRVLHTSTLFLIETLTPESRGGRRFDTLRMSRAFWLQILVVLLATWLLVQPRWVRTESAQVVVAVLDDSASMNVFRTETQAAVEKIFSANDGRAARTEWVVMTSNPRQPILYRGTNKSAALEAVTKWKPTSGAHDAQATLQLARSLSAKSGITWFFTDRKGRASEDQPTVGAGRVLENVGFAGARVFKDETGTWAWRALVRNFSDKTLVREWWIENRDQKSPLQRIALAPGAISEISAQFPKGIEACELVLTSDAFAADDRLPMVQPVAKRLSVSMEMNSTKEREFFEKLARNIEGVVFVPRDSGALRLADASSDTVLQKGAAIYVARSTANAQESTPRTARVAPVTAEPHRLTEGLNWQGFIGAGTANLRRAESAEVLLWQESNALVWVTSGAAAEQQLVLNFEWDSSNASRLPSFVLLVRRFIEEIQDAQIGQYSANFDTNASIKIGVRGMTRSAGAPSRLTFETQQGVREVDDAEESALRAPAEAGFFTIRRGEEILVRGAAQFADTRQGDFRSAETFVANAPDAAMERGAWMRNSRPDPFANVWLLAIGAALLWSWWPRLSPQNPKLAKTRSR